MYGEKLGVLSYSTGIIILKNKDFFHLVPYSLNVFFCFVFKGVVSCEPERVAKNLKF